MLKSTNYFDYMIIGIYFFVMILCSVLLTKFNKDEKDFFKAGGKIPWAMASLSIFIGAFSSYMFVAAAGQVYKVGIPAAVIFTSTSLAYIGMALFFAKKFRRTRITSPMEYVEMRYGRITKIVMTYLQIPVLLLLTGNLLYVLCIFISSALGIKEQFTILGIELNGLQFSMVFTGLVIIIYTAIGGLWAVIITDTVQFVIAMVASILLAVRSYFVFKGDDTFINSLNEYVSNAPIEGYFGVSNEFQPISFTLAWVALMIFSQPGHLPLIQRCACVPTERDAQKSCWLAVVFFILCPMIWLFPVFILRNQLPNMAELWPHLNNPAEASYVTIALQLLPNGMIGLVISAILAASISSMAGCLNVVSLIFTNDVYNKFIDKEASHKRLVIVGKLSSIVVGILTVIIGISLSGFADAFRTTFTIVSHTGLAMALPMVLGFIYKKVPWWSGIVGMTACFITTLTLEFLTLAMIRHSASEIWQHMHKHLFEYKIFGAIFVNLLVFGVARLFYRPARDTQYTNKLFGLLKIPVTKDADVEMVVGVKAYKVVGIALLFFGFPLLISAIFGITEDKYMVNLYAGLIFLSLSGLILWLTSEKYSPIALVRTKSYNCVK